MKILEGMGEPPKLPQPPDTQTASLTVGTADSEVRTMGQRGHTWCTDGTDPRAHLEGHT